MRKNYAPIAVLGLFADLFLSDHIPDRKEIRALRGVLIRRSDFNLFKAQAGQLLGKRP